MKLLDQHFYFLPEQVVDNYFKGFRLRKDVLNYGVFYKRVWIILFEQKGCDPAHVHRRQVLTFFDKSDELCG